MSKRVVLACINLYQQYISPILGPRCRFYPSCSQYAKEAIVSQGLITGGWTAIKRLVKCHPYHPGGVDRLETIS